MGNCFRKLRPSADRRAVESHVSEKKQFIAPEVQGSPPSQASDNEPQSLDNKGGSPIDKVKPLRKEQYPTDMPDSERLLQGNMQMQVQLL